MNRRGIFLSVAILTALFGVGSLLYGLAKVALAAESKPMAVEIELPGAVAMAPPDEASRTLGYRACGLGAVCLVAAAILFLFNPGGASNVRRGRAGDPEDVPLAERGRG